MIDVKGKTVFLSGPVTGLDRYETYGAFLDAQKALRGLGARDCFVPTEYVPEQFTHEHAMQLCLHELTELDPDAADDGVVVPYYHVLVSLPGWEDSPGARLEREVAEACGIECHDLAEVVADA